MPRHLYLSVCSVAIVLTLAPARVAFSQEAQRDPATPAPQAASTDDDGVIRPLEPDYTLINLPTTLPLPLHKGNFRLTHRFNGNLRGGKFSDKASSLFGIDEGATVGFEYRFAVFTHVEAAAYRTGFNRTIQIYGKYDAFHQLPTNRFGLSALASVEGTNNFRENYATAIGASISHDIANVLAVYAVPMAVLNSAAGTGETRNTGMLGIGGSLRVRPTLHVVGEVTPRLGGYVIGDAEYGFGIQTRVGGHVFDLTFTNTTQGTTFAQMARGGFPKSLYLGFNLARKFY